MSRSLTSRITIEPLDLSRDVGLLHAWVTHPRSAFWMMQDASLDDVRTEYAAIAADPPHHDAFLGRIGGRPHLPGGDLRPGARHRDG